MPTSSSMVVKGQVGPGPGHPGLGSCPDLARAGRVGSSCLFWPTAIIPCLSRATERARVGSRRMKPAILLPRECPQDHSLFFVANGDKSAPISRAGMAREPGTRGVDATLLLLLLIAGFLRGPRGVHHPSALPGPPQVTSDTARRGSGGQRKKDRLQEERGQEKARKRTEEMGVY